mmetsp:Transcript_28665/g.44914  ORF Transcript_28665/g.44914 Transcript_28665/m.44914 type:complete len:263 (-) Transcript_28665:122-910(-)|eukprot:CAMPEP_0184302176 /NCGR_PEP_ID=MMETSP1049-20130417/12218_1 /TAXON_ID=77928 /ORGANISM="Proteomonas sulcata, Strain CCMP704" /LENGTH=262 /DNA_ID=CAMNT_0026613391 /DNA_START=223 /DNA_END=1011 /DNA_ORIENTATION=+
MALRTVLAVLGLSSLGLGLASPANELQRPDSWHDPPALMARWLVHAADWGTVSTIASDDGNKTRTVGFPFGKIVTCTDGWGKEDLSTGRPIVALTDFMGTVKDLEAGDFKASITFSEKEVPGLSLWQSILTMGLCQCCVRWPGWKGGKCNFGEDSAAQWPMCAHVTLQGHLKKIANATEVELANQALVKKNPAAASWITGKGLHKFQPWRFEVLSIYLIEHFGGAPFIPVDKYLSADLSALRANRVPLHDSIIVDNAGARVH